MHHDEEGFIFKRDKRPINSLTKMEQPEDGQSYKLDFKIAKVQIWYWYLPSNLQYHYGVQALTFYSQGDEEVLNIGTRDNSKLKEMYSIE